MNIIMLFVRIFV